MLPNLFPFLKKIPIKKWATYLTENLLTAQIKDLFAYLKIVYLKLTIRKQVNKLKSK